MLVALALAIILQLASYMHTILLFVLKALATTEILSYTKISSTIINYCKYLIDRFYILQLLYVVAS